MPAADDYDVSELVARLGPWFRARLGGEVEITSIEAPGESGFSSETLLVDLTADGASHRYVVKTKPMGFWVFPSYDMERQAILMRAVGEFSDVPVPEVPWYEGDPAVLEREFYVMNRVDGLVPPDRMPYTIHGFLFDALPEDQARLQRRSLEVLAALHCIDIDEAGLRFLDARDDGPTGLDQQLTYYRRWIPDALGGRRHPTIEAATSWLSDNKPVGLPEGLSWGDSRIGNIIYDGFEPAAVVDWEMAALGPPEQDLAWFLYIHRFFTSILGLPDLPGFASEEECIALYEQRLGRSVQRMDWFFAFAAYRYAVIMVRLMDRPGAAAGMPDDWTRWNNPMTQALAEYTGQDPPTAEP